RPSVYAVAARKTDDIVAAVNFALENKLRLVVKGGGHSYQGTSCAPDSLLIWTREMNAISLQQAFVGKGCEKVQAPQPAVSVGAEGVSKMRGSRAGRSGRRGRLLPRRVRSGDNARGPLRSGWGLHDGWGGGTDSKWRLRQLFEEIRSGGGGIT